MILLGEPPRGVVTGTDLRTHLLVDGVASCGATESVASLIVTREVAVVTCSACLAAPLMAAS